MITYLIYFALFLYIFNRTTCGWCYSKVCLLGRTTIITGGNSGIGYQTALSLASRGCRVIIADKDDATQSANKIIRETNNPNVLARHLDLASFASVRQFAKDIIETEPRADILINNAGIGNTDLKYTEDGLQLTMQVNYFGHFLLTHLLVVIVFIDMCRMVTDLCPPADNVVGLHSTLYLSTVNLIPTVNGRRVSLVDLLKKSAPSRIIFTSSLVSLVGKLNLEKSSKDTFLNYPYSKICQTIAAKCFAEKLSGTGVTAYSLHPGAVRSGIFWKTFKANRSLWSALFGIISLIFGKAMNVQLSSFNHNIVFQSSSKQSGWAPMTQQQSLVTEAMNVQLSSFNHNIVFQSSSKQSGWAPMTQQQSLVTESTEEGAQTSIYLATDPAVEKASGSMFLDCFEFFYPFQVYDDKFCQDVWAQSKKFVKLTADECVI